MESKKWRVKNGDGRPIMGNENKVTEYENQETENEKFKNKNHSKI
jgi:hypothetical protein